VLVLVAFLAAFTQGLTGFGSALVAMAVLPGLLSIRVAAPLVALMAGTIEGVLLARYRHAFNLRAVWRLVLAMLLGVPLGIFALRQVEERLVLAILGLVIAGYALYALLNPQRPRQAGKPAPRPRQAGKPAPRPGQAGKPAPPPRLKHPAWAYGFGFLAGVLGGAYNTSGPPVVIYGNCRRWPPAEFKGNLQGFFLVNDLLVVAGHALSRNLAPPVLRDYLIALPALALGLFVGSKLDQRLDPELFRKVVLVLLVVMGLRMLLFAVLVAVVPG
jgi:hypothetical protein